MAFVMHFLPAALMAPVRDDHIEIAPQRPTARPYEQT